MVVAERPQLVRPRLVLPARLAPGASSHFAPSTTYAVEVSWGQSWATGGLFTFGTSQLGGPDVLTASAFSGSFNVPYGDLTDRTRTISIVRGRDDLLSSMQAGQLSLGLIDPDGLLNVNNPASPLYGAVYTGVPIRVSAWTSGGVKTPIYYGFIDTLTSDPGGRYGTAQITASDFFERLQREKPNLGSLAGQTDGSLFGALLDAVGWTDPLMRALATGDSLPSPYTRADGTNDVLSLVEEALQAERGYFYVSGSGAVTYRSRYQVLQGAPLATLDRTMTGAPATLDASKIVNRWTVTRVAMDGTTVIGTPQVAAVDPLTDVSYRRYHYIDGAITTPMLVNDNQALALAQYLLSITKDAVGIGWSVPVNPSDSATLDALISLDLGDRVTLTVDPSLWASYTADFTIEQIKHDIQTQPGATRHSTTWGLASVPDVQPFTFGVSQLGGTDVLVY